MKIVDDAFSDLFFAVLRYISIDYFLYYFFFLFLVYHF